MYSHLQPHAERIPLTLRAIAAVRKKKDRIGASRLRLIFCRTLHDLVAIRECRRTLRYRDLLGQQTVQMKNKLGMLLMEAGSMAQALESRRARHFRHTTVRVCTNSFERTSRDGSRCAANRSKKSSEIKKARHFPRARPVFLDRPTRLVLAGCPCPVLPAHRTFTGRRNIFSARCFQRVLRPINLVRRRAMH
jgi:hypothetical protein